MDFQPHLASRCERKGRNGTGNRLQGTDLALELTGRTTPVQKAFRTTDLARHRGKGVVLRETGCITQCQKAQGFAECLRRKQCQTVRETTRGFAAAQEDPPFQNHIPGIESFRHVHDGNAALQITCGNG